MAKFNVDSATKLGGTEWFVQADKLAEELYKRLKPNMKLETLCELLVKYQTHIGNKRIAHVLLLRAKDRPYTPYKNGKMYAGAES